MNGQREGFTIVELIIVAVLGAVILGAVFQTLAVQQRGMRHEGTIIMTQQNNRLALQLLSGELRELSSSGGDIIAAGPDSIRFNAVRKVGFICFEDSVGNAMTLYRLGDQAFATNDSLLIFRDGDPAKSTDDSWIKAGAGTVGTASASCVGTWTGSTKQGFSGLAAGALSGVVTGAPVRSFERVTYALRQVAGQWSLARRGPGATDTMVALIGPLASAADSGINFHFSDTMGVTIAQANVASSLNKIGRITIRVKSKNPGAAQATMYLDSLKTQINLRGN
jgi:type II secretory pathway pseudopilin PulG